MSYAILAFIVLLIRYKCPKCRAPFCCVQCSKDHKANHCPATKTTKSDVEKIDAANTNVSSSTAAAAATEQSKYLPQKELLKTKRKRIRRTDHNDDEDSDDDEPGWQITSEMKRRIYNSTWIRNELQDGGLRQLIESIDAASDKEEDEAGNGDNKHQYKQQRYHHHRGNLQKNNTAAKISPRELALARTKHSHPKFSAFIDEMLLTAGVLQRNNGVDDGNREGDKSLLSNILDGGDRKHLVLAPVPRRKGSDGLNKSEDDIRGHNSDDDSNSSEDESESSDSSEDSSDGEVKEVK